MAAPWDVLVSTSVGAVATIIGIVVGGFVGRRSQNQQWLRDTQTAAYGAFLQEFTAVEIELREAYLDDRPNNANWPPFNAALTSLSLVATPDVANAAGDLADAIGRFALLVADRSPKNRDNLQRIMAELASGQLAFVNAARSSLDGSQQPINRQLGGPPPWREIEPYLPTPGAAD
ncbi:MULTISPECIES: hypothetical protein [Streptomyces]|uniref:Uncharacterized protein n=1 Tax=Streptomyces doebereineriae TaxID=3075528 RepID=A0ABU2VIN0_9ACTN|nr:hypothetical protein [Streptomyces sp. DSM 41640]MDT0485436.1 hypothetical protein [Streptomyces sp. DSM 41640]